MTILRLITRKSPTGLVPNEVIVLEIMKMSLMRTLNDMILSRLIHSLILMCEGRRRVLTVHSFTDLDGNLIQKALNLLHWHPFKKILFEHFRSTVFMQVVWFISRSGGRSFHPSV